MRTRLVEPQQGSSFFDSEMFLWLVVASVTVAAFGGYLNLASDIGNVALIGGAIAAPLVALLAIRRMSFRFVNLALAALVVSGIPGYVLSEYGSDYQRSKVLLMATLVPLLLFSGTLIGSAVSGRRAFILAAVFINAVVLLIAVRTPDEELAALGRLAGEDVTYQTAGRAGGTVLVVCTAMMMNRSASRLWRVLSAVLVAISLYWVVLSGSRAPIYGAVAAALLIVLLMSKRRWSVLLASVPAVLAIAFGSPEFVPQRVTAVWDNSSQGRVEAFWLTVSEAMSSPLGSGWGSAEIVLAKLGFRYPHNIFIEAMLEAGLVFGFILVVVVLLVFFRAAAKCIDSANAWDSCVVALLLYFTINASFSGDLTSNRGFWIMLGMAIALSGVGRKYAHDQNIHREVI